MSFSVRIAADLVSVEAGATVPLGIEIANRSDESDRFELEIEGLDPDWTAVPVPTFGVDPRDIQSEKVFFKPPRVSESLAGTYPFVLKVRSLVTGELRTAQGVLEIKPYHHLTMEVSPKKGVYSSTRKANVFHATVMNLGNTEHTLQLFATDPEDALAYEFDQNQVVLGPGQTRTIEITAKPTESRTFSSSRLHGFSVSARSIETPSVVCSTQAQLEERPLMSPSALLVAILFALVFAGWYVLLPKPPTVDSLSISSMNPTRGQEVTVEWSTSNATSVRLLIGNQVFDGQRPQGERRFLATESGTIEVIAMRDSKTSTPVRRTFTVSDPAPVPPPVIERFEITPKEVKFGESLLIRYKLSGDIRKATLEPTGQELDPDIEQLRITADLRGEVTYTLVAENSAGAVVRKPVKIRVVEGSSASIVVFKVEPIDLPVEGGNVRISWQLANAARVELSVGGEQSVIEPTGTREVIITSTTEFTITGYDDEGRTVTRSLTVKVAPPPALEPPPTTGGDAPPPGATFR